MKSGNGSIDLLANEPVRRAERLNQHPVNLLRFIDNPELRKKAGKMITELRALNIFWLTDFTEAQLCEKYGHAVVDTVREVLREYYKTDFTKIPLYSRLPRKSDYPLS